MDIGYIFFYGTLRKNTASKIHDKLVCHCEYLSDSYLQGKLYEVGGYPGVVVSDSAADKVYGEIYKILHKGKLFALLDEYEGCTETFPEPHEYCRKQLPVYLANNKTVYAWVYVYNHDVSNLFQIKSGDYVKHISAS